MKKWFITLCLGLALILCACTGAGGADTQKTEKEGTDETVAESESITEVQTELQTEKETEYIPPRRITVACVGDSITYGVGASNQALTSWPALVGTALGKDYRILNFGLSRSYMIDRADYPDFSYASAQSSAYKQSAQYKSSLESAPDVVLIALGANDAYVAANQPKTAEYFKASAAAMIKTYQQLPTHPTVILLLPTSRFDSAARRTSVQNVIIPALREAAAENGCETVDLFTPTNSYAQASDKTWFGDGVHPTDKGYTLIRDILVPVLKEYRLPG